MSRPIGVVTARFDQRDVYAERCDLAGQRLGETFQRPLGGVVDAHVRKRGDAADRGHLDDVPGALFTPWCNAFV
jgi:hypothetical protein